jgi:hypothetical protein
VVEGRIKREGICKCLDTEVEVLDEDPHDCGGKRGQTQRVANRGGRVGSTTTRFSHNGRLNNFVECGDTTRGGFYIKGDEMVGIFVTEVNEPISEADGKGPLAAGHDNLNKLAGRGVVDLPGGRGANGVIGLDQARVRRNHSPEFIRT